MFLKKQKNFFYDRKFRSKKHKVEINSNYSSNQKSYGDAEYFHKQCKINARSKSLNENFTRININQSINQLINQSRI